MTHPKFCYRFPLGVGIIAVVALLGVPGQVDATAEATDVTYARDVAPILQQKCQVCHQPNSIAPMSLLTYREARPWARSIKAKVLAREMPPWHIDKTVGIQRFKNDRSLSDDEIETIVGWVDAGAPQGNPTDAPAPIEWPDPNAWRLAEQFGEPDLIVPSEPYTVPADGQDKWWKSTVDTGLTAERWVKAIEIKPSFPLGRKVVHHAIAGLVQEEDGVTGLAASAANPDDDADIGPGTFMEWAVGKEGEIFPDGAGKLMLPDSQIRWDVHYHAVGEEVKDDVIEIGVYFYPEGEQPKYRTILHMMRASRSGLDIPPNSIGMTQGFTVLKAPARLENFQPHMHMRGKAMSMEAIYPDGRRELLSNVENFQWNWHVNYVYDDAVAPVLPAGTMIAITAWHDNTEANRNNPDYRQWVGNGSRTVDEMAHAWVDVTYLNEDDYEAELAKREALETNDNDE